MKKIDWNAVEEINEFKGIVPGGYIAKITNVLDEPQKEYLRVELDIADGEYKDYYKQLAESKGFWGLTMYRSYKESALGFFKNFKSCVEKSNKGYIFDSDEKSLEGKLIGVVLGEEEYVGNDGSEKKRIRVSSTKPVDDIKAGKFKVPEIKKLDTKSVIGTMAAGSVIADEEIPF